METGLRQRIAERRVPHLLTISRLDTQLAELTVPDRQRQRINCRLEQVRVLGKAQHGPPAALDVHDQLSVDHDDQRTGLPARAMTACALSLGPRQGGAIRIRWVGSREYDGPRYAYFPAVKAEEASRSALRQLVRTFFNDSNSSAMAALLDMSEQPLSADEYRRLSALLKRVREQGEKR